MGAVTVLIIILIIISLSVSFLSSFFTLVGQVLGDRDERSDLCPEGRASGGLTSPVPWAHSLNFRLNKMTPLV